MDRDSKRASAVPVSEVDIEQQRRRTPQRVQGDRPIAIVGTHTTESRQCSLDVIEDRGTDRAADSACRTLPVPRDG